MTNIFFIKSHLKVEKSDNVIGWMENTRVLSLIKLTGECSLERVPKGHPEPSASVKATLKTEIKLANPIAHRAG